MVLIFPSSEITDIHNMNKSRTCRYSHALPVRLHTVFTSYHPRTDKSRACGYLRALPLHIYTQPQQVPNPQVLVCSPVYTSMCIHNAMQCSAMQSADPQPRLQVTNGISSKQKKKKGKNAARPITTLNSQLPYNSLPPCNAATATTPLTPLISLTGHAPPNPLAPDDRLDGVGAAVPSAAVWVAVGLTDATRLVGEPDAEPDAGGLEALGEEEVLGSAAEAAEGASTAAAAAGTEDFAGAEGCVWDCVWDGPEGVGVGVGEDVGFCTSASALPLPFSLGAAALASSPSASLICEEGVSWAGCFVYACF